MRNNPIVRQWNTLQLFKKKRIGMLLLEKSSERNYKMKRARCKTVHMVQYLSCKKKEIRMYNPVFLCLHKEKPEELTN